VELSNLKKKKKIHYCNCMEETDKSILNSESLFMSHRRNKDIQVCNDIRARES